MTAADHFHQYDPSGLQTLERFSAAVHFNRWLFQTIQPFCKGHVLEVGSGIGNLTKLFLQYQYTITASDLREEYCNILEKEFGGQLAGVELLDLAEKELAVKKPALLERFDTVVALNVVEHIEQCDLAVSNCSKMLRPGGQLVILVPAYQTLYNSFDEELGHYKRYSARALRKLVTSQGFTVQKIQFFNAAGMLGWFVNGSILRRKLIPATQLKIFDRLLPLFKLADSITGKRIGLSVIASATKPE